MEPADKVLVQFEKQLRGILEDSQTTNLQLEPAEDPHGFAEKLDEQLKDTLRPGPQREPVENLQSVVSELDHADQGNSEQKEIQHRLVAIEREMKKRRSRGFASYLIAIGIGVAVTLAWQSYGEATKQIIATKTPELGWSPATKQTIASWMNQLWTKPPTVESSGVRSPVPETPQAAPVAQTEPEKVVPSAPSVPSIDPEQVHQMALDLATLRQTVGQVPEQVHQIALDLAALQQTVGQVAANQDQMARDITGLQTFDQEILEKMPAPPQPRRIAAPTRKPTSVAPPSSRAPTRKNGSG
jgi:hypothetical protein